MWDNPVLLNRTASLLFVAAALMAAWGGIRMLMESALFPLRTIRIEGELAQVRRADVVAVLEGRLSGTFFNMNIDALRSLFETVPWVRRAEVRRVWPDQLQVRMEEHVPLARWGQPGDGRLVNTFGEVFSAGYQEQDGAAPLPLFSGPPGTSIQVAGNYLDFQRTLAAIDLVPRAVMLSPRLSWQLKLSNGMSIQIGRESDKERVADRLARFAAIYTKSIAPLSRRLDYVDLRYPNGFALRVPGMKDVAPAGARLAPSPTPQRAQERKKSA